MPGDPRNGEEEYELEREAFLLDILLYDANKVGMQTKEDLPSF